MIRGQSIKEWLESPDRNQEVIQRMKHNEEEKLRAENEEAWSKAWILTVGEVNAE